MGLTADELFLRSLDKATSVFARLKPSDYGKPTPDDDWDVHALANHMLYEISWVPDILAGRRVAADSDRYDGDLLGSDPPAAWAEAAALARGQVRLYDPDGIALVSYGEIYNDEYLREVAGDLLIHNWDLAAALGLDRSVDFEAAATVYRDLRPEVDKLQGTGVYGPPLKVSRFADPLAKLLTITGRDAGWHPA